MRQTNLVSLLLPLLAIGLLAAEPAGNNVFADELVAVAGNTLTPEQKTALAAVDVRLAGVEALVAKIDDPDYKAEVAKQIEDLKQRRLALEKNFDPGLYETLMHSVISRYQVIALWLKPPPLPPPPAAALELPVNGCAACRDLSISVKEAVLCIRQVIQDLLHDCRIAIGRAANKADKADDDVRK